MSGSTGAASASSPSARPSAASVSQPGTASVATGDAPSFEGGTQAAIDASHDAAQTEAEGDPTTAAYHQPGGDYLQGYTESEITDALVAMARRAAREAGGAVDDIDLTKEEVEDEFVTGVR